jgi:hypothetical protein
MIFKEAVVSCFKVLAQHEVNHSSPSSVKVKNAWNSSSTPPVRLHNVVFN